MEIKDIQQRLARPALKLLAGGRTSSRAKGRFTMTFIKTAQKTDH